VSGTTLTETTLTTSNVGPNTFGLVFNLALDDTVFAQPLYVPNVAIANQGTHNVVYVATMSDTLYAFDADVGGAPLWQINLATRVGATPVPIANFVFSGNRNITGNLGILSTPVIDPGTQLMYVVAGTLEGGTMVYRLHAVDIRSGAEPNGPGTLISASYGGSTFDARYQTQRVSLALAASQVVFGFGAVELEYAGGYVGWMMAYDKTTLQQTGAFATVTTGNRGGGVWQSGRPPVVDAAGYVYVFVGNAYGSGYDGVNNFSESVLKLNPANHMALVDWFTPGNWGALDNGDLDLTSSGPLLVPGTSLLAGGGKTGDLYVLNTAHLGKFNATDSQVAQKEHISASEFRGGPVYWQRSAAAGGPLLYNWGVNDRAKSYAFNGSTFATSASSQGTITNQIFPGAILALSANGEQSGSGVLWATTAASGDAENNPPVPGVLHAFDAQNLTVELWNSATNAARDSFGNLAKFVPPLVANGRVYVATQSNQVAVYGLIAAAPVTTVNLAPFANVDGIFKDGTVLSSGGLDGGGRAYSSIALGGSSLTWGAVPFALGAVNALDAVSNRTITLPAGKFSALSLLAAAVNGNRPSQTVRVTYTDGTSTSSVISVSDWCTPQHYAGESIAKAMAVRDTNRGAVLRDCSSVNVYGYAMTLNPAKSIKSLSLPANGNVVALAVSLTH
jgi:hypothetical protein